jgi:Sec-independent protein secretion pathway component TatC
MLAIPMWALYEAGILVARALVKARKNAEKRAADGTN